VTAEETLLNLANEEEEDEDGILSSPNDDEEESVGLISYLVEELRLLEVILELIGSNSSSQENKFNSFWKMCGFGKD